MPEIILTQQQAKIIVEAREPVIVHDAAMKVRIVSEPYDAVALAEYHRDRLSGVEQEGIPAEKVSRYLKALEVERIRLGYPLDEAYIDQFIARLQKREAAMTTAR